ncbi:MAG: hypothetical protein P1U87_20450 [Verrucomicrobiales bacterium]|nr:hypothetical protein [Verrucomicrobiales bacterium]
MPDRSGWLFVLGVFALSFSWLPIVAIPSAVAVVIFSARAFRESESKGLLVGVIGLGVVALFLGLGNSIAGVRVALENNQRQEAQRNILRVHEKIDQLETEIKSPEHAREIARQWASIDISRCPGEYQEAYREVVTLFFDIADHVEKLKSPWERARVFLEGLSKSVFGGGQPSPLAKDAELQERMNRVISQFSLVCAKYDIRMVEPGKGT